MLVVLLLGCTGATGAGDEAPLWFPTRGVTRAAPLDPPAADGPILGRAEALGVRDGPAALADEGEGWEAQWYGQVSAPHCTALEERVRRPGGERYVDALAFCGDPRHAGLLARADTPPHALVHWAEALRDRGEPLPPAALEGAVRVAADPDRWRELAPFLRGLCETDLPDLAPALHAILDATPPESRAAMASFCPHQSDARLARAWRDACPAGACVQGPDVLADPDAAVRSAMWLPGLFVRYPQHAKTFERALERCARDPQADRAPFCLEALAERDWAAAAGIAATRAPAAEPAMSEVQATLARFGSHDALVAHLVGLGMLTPAMDARITWREPEASALTVLFNRDRVPSAGHYVPHALARTAIRVPGLEHAVAQTLPPPDDEEEGRWTLQLWVGTTRYQAMVPVWEDELESVAGFLNAVLEAEGLPTRLAQPSAETGNLVIGPGDALRSLAEDGLLRLEDHRHGD